VGARIRRKRRRIILGGPASETERGGNQAHESSREAHGRGIERDGGGVRVEDCVSQLEAPANEMDPAGDCP
jgi:hypothetical protein